MLRGNELINETGQDGIQRTLWRIDCPEPRMLQETAFKASVASVGHRRRFRTFYNLQRAFAFLANALPGEPVKPAGSCQSRVWNANAHRDVILQVAHSPIRKTAHKRAYMILSQTGSFVKTISDEDLSSRERFEKAFRERD